VVKRVEARNFIETLASDGARDKTSCRWLRQQGWREGSSATNERTSAYSRYWFQGIDRAIERIYFKGNEQ